MLQCVAVCCSMLQCVAVCCSVLQWGAVCSSVFSVLQCVAVFYSVLQCHEERITAPLRYAWRQCSKRQNISPARKMTGKKKNPKNTDTVFCFSEKLGRHSIENFSGSIGCLKLQVSFRKRGINYRALLSPPCINWMAYRVAKMHRMPYLCRSYSVKEPYNWWFFCGKRPAT